MSGKILRNFSFNKKARPVPAVIGAAVRGNNDADAAAEVTQTTEFGGTGMEAAPRPPQDANGARQNSDNPESQPKDRKKSLDRKISFDAAIAEPESALGGATEAGELNGDRTRRSVLKRKESRGVLKRSESKKVLKPRQHQDLGVETENSCAVCMKSDFTKEQLNFCKYSKKNYCLLCFGSHTKVLRSQLQEVKGLLEESNTEVDRLKEHVLKKLADIEVDADRHLESRIETLRSARSRLKEASDKRRETAATLVEDVKKEISGFMQSQSVAQEAAESDADMISRFMAVQEEYGKIRSRVDQIGHLAKVELNADTFSIEERSNPRKISSPLDSNSAAVARQMSTRRQSSSGLVVGTTKFGQVYGKIRCKRIPTDAAVCPWNNQIYACCPDSKCIDVYEKNGKLTNTIDCAELELLSYPVRVAFSSAEVVFLDKWSHSLVIYSYPEMTFLRTIGGQGGAPGKFNSPQGLDVDDETGNIFVADTGNDRVQILTKSGRFQRFIGGKMVKDPKNGRSFCQTELSQPEDVSVSGDGITVAVADTGNNRVRLYTIKGQQLSVVGMRGKGNGQFDLPLSVVITPANLLVVGERNNARLQVFTLSGQFQKIVRGYKHVSSLRSNSSKEEDDFSVIALEGNTAHLTLLH